MTDIKRVRQLHKLLDKVAESRVLDSSDMQHLRAALPELPKQKTLEELRREVHDVWVGVNGNEWPDEVHGNLGTWLVELYDQLKGLEPTHPEFLETDSDYVNTPVGTVVIHEDGYPWTRIFGSWVAYPYGQYTPYEMAALLGKARVLRWGGGVNEQLK